MKKSLVAVLLSLVALTLVAGAAFAGTSFDVTFTVTLDGTAKEVTVDLSKASVLTSKDFTIGQKLSGDVATISDKLEAGETVAFAVKSGDVTLDNTYTLDADGKLAAAEKTITADTTYVLAVASKDKYYAVKAAVTFKGSEEKGNPTTVSKVSDKALEAATKKFPAGTKMFGADAFELTLTSKDYEAIKSDISSKSIKLYTTPANITEDGAVVFKITLKGINKNRLLAWFTMMLAAASGDTVSISSATEIGTVYYFDDDSGKEIMLNDTTTADDQTVDVAFEVKKGRQVFGVSDNDPKNGGGSPSSGCDMGLLGSLALFAVALLPLRKSR